MIRLEKRLEPSRVMTAVTPVIAVVLTMSLISTLYPARIATRIEPVTAMQTNE